MLDVADVKAGQGQFNVAKVTRAIGQFEFARGTSGGFVAHAQARVQHSRGGGGASRHGKEIAGCHLEFG